MKSIFVPSILALILSLVTGCKHHTDLTSQATGHFEDYEEATLTRFSGQQTIVPEYHPSQGVVIALELIRHYKFEEFAAQLLEQKIKTLWIFVPAGYSAEQEQADLGALYQKLGAAASKVKLIKPDQDGAQTVWTRDYAPLTAKDTDGALRLIDFNYYTYRQADDSIPSAMKRSLSMERISLPVYNEGGNFMINGRGDCLIGKRVLWANSAPSHPRDLVLDEKQIEDYFKNYGGCKRVAFFHSMPYEQTGHIDIWAKFLDDNTIIVNELRDEVINLDVFNDEEKRKQREIKSFLDERASEIVRLGFKVMRTPLLAPYPFRWGFKSGEQAEFRSYTNSLLVNGAAFVPQFKKEQVLNGGAANDYRDGKFISAYENEVQKTYESYGYKVIWVNSDRIYKMGGTVHCTTMQIPE
jgi:agmatine/peptidylarginine deiminase